jgi:hypothetical protein
MTEKRKAKVVTIKLGEDIRKSIPKAGDTIYRIVKTPAADGDNPDEDETFFLRTLETVDVEGTRLVDGGKAVDINGDFEISLDLEEKPDVWTDEDDAIAEWLFQTEQECQRAEKAQDKLNHIVNALQTSRDEKQF